MVLFISLGIVRYIGTHIRRMLHAEHKFDEEESIEPTRIDP